MERQSAFVKKWMEKEAVGIAAKIIVSGITASCFILMFQVMQLWYSYSASAARISVKPPAAPTQTGGTLQKQVGFGEGNGIFWPHFPGSDNAIVHQMRINGVETISEDWQTTALACDVVAYYRGQMLARGWRETTEENFQLQPESRSAGIGKNGVQNPEYLKKYESIMNSSLVLNRGEWCIQVVAVASEKGVKHTDVRVFAADTPYINDLGLSLVSGGMDNENIGQTNTIDTLQEDGSHCRTTKSAWTAVNAFTNPFIAS